jgi:SAM-dependent methyltransferase
MRTMPSRLPTGQPAGPTDRGSAWFESAAGRALLDSETDSIRSAFHEREGQSWLWLAPTADGAATDGRGLRLQATGSGWAGPVRCAAPLPLANETVATIVIQHAARGGGPGTALVEECARVLVPGGRLWLYALNPLSPYRLRWNGWGLSASEPMPWRRRLRDAGLQPDAVSQGLGPRWRIETSPSVQQGPGLRAAWLLRAEKRMTPLTPVRQRVPLRLGDGVPAA